MIIFLKKAWLYIKKLWYILVAIGAVAVYFFLRKKPVVIIDPGEKPEEPEEVQPATDFLTINRAKREEIDERIKRLRDDQLLDDINRDYGKPKE